MLKIRLARHGAKKRPFYQIVVADSRKPRDGRYIEKLGNYNPKLPREDANRVNLNAERITYWLGQGAQPTDRVAIFLGKAGITDMPAQKDRPQKSKPKAKAQERVREREEKANAAAEAEKEAAAAAKAAAEAPAEEVKEETPAEEVSSEETPAEEA